MHAFEDLAFTASTSEGKKLFDGKSIRIVPKRIDTVDFEMQHRKIGFLVEMLAKHYSAENTYIQLDLATNSVIIDGVTYSD